MVLVDCCVGSLPFSNLRLHPRFLQLRHNYCCALIAMALQFLFVAFPRLLYILRQCYCKTHQPKLHYMHVHAYSHIIIGQYGATDKGDTLNMYLWTHI